MSRPECRSPYACENCRPTEWREVDYFEDWLPLGVTPDETLAWQMDPIAAHWWMQVGASRQEAHDLQDLGFNIDEVER